LGPLSSRRSILEAKSENLLIPEYPTEVTSILIVLVIIGLFGGFEKEKL
jgi:hypothetical protein